VFPEPNVLSPKFQVTEAVDIKGVLVLVNTYTLLLFGDKAAVKLG
jgi:hypothetical protein